MAPLSSLDFVTHEYELLSNGAGKLQLPCHGELACHRPCLSCVVVLKTFLILTHTDVSVPRCLLSSICPLLCKCFRERGRLI